MEVSYKRHFSQSYMILQSEAYPRELYELSMLAYNQIPGLLPIETEIADGQTRFWYDITGKQSLEDYLKRKSADSRLLLPLFRSLENVWSQVAAHLLNEECLLLEQEYLYLDFDHDHLEFVYLPGEKQDIRAAFRRLMEQLLQRLDHSDKQAVAMAYEMYQMSLDQERSFADMVCRAAAVCRTGDEIDTPKDGEYLKESDDDEIREREYFKNRIEESKRNESNKRNIIDWVNNKIKSILIFHKEKKESKPGRQSKSQTVKNGWESEDELLQPTELLDVNQIVQGLLAYQGDEEGRDIRIDKPVFLIGKKEDEVDGYIDNKGISRIHARVETEDRGYYIEDLNSTNGTYLNGERLEYRQKVKLEPRDVVVFGVEKYIFL